MGIAAHGAEACGHYAFEMTFSHANPYSQRPAGRRKSTKGSLAVAIVVVFFGLALLGVGSSIFQAAGEGQATARDLQVNGLPGTVTDAKVMVGRGQGGTRTVSEMELTFMDEQGMEHTAGTTHIPRYYPPSNAESGWTSEFPAKDQLLGQAVKYRLGDDAAVELVEQLPAAAAAPWTIPRYIGLVLGIFGIFVLVGALAMGVKSFRKRS